MSATEPYYTFFIRSWMDRQTGQTRHQLYWNLMYSDQAWRFYSRSNDDSARSLRTVEINRNVVTCAGSRYRGCTYSETMGAELDEGVLRAAGRAGRNYCVKFYARSGNETIACVTAEMINAQFEAIDRRRPRATQPVPAQRPTQPVPQRPTQPVTSTPFT